ncbi:MAG: NAD-dependent epimerase/dehydratase family protein [Candidatus Woesearchaeota archaeon]|jgi:UDP-glucose 4-epimerase
MSVVVVTGGAGFIGSHVVDHFVKKGCEVRVVDNLLTGKLENLNESMSKIKFFKLDICNYDEILKVFKGSDFVIHLAALPSVPRSIKDPRTSHINNVLGSLSVFDAAKEAGVKKVVYASSSSVYGDTEELPKHEGMIPRPKSPYALQKYMCERYANYFADNYPCDFIGLRFFNIFGPRQNPNSEYAAVIPKFIKLAKEGKQITIYGDGLATRNFTYVENVVHAIDLACQSSGITGKVFNVAAGQEIFMNDLVLEIEKLIGKKLNVVHSPVRKGDIIRSFADLTLAKKYLNFEVVVPFTMGIERTEKSM